MKRALSLFLAALTGLTLFALAACGGSSSSAPPASAAAPPPASTASSSTAPASQPGSLAPLYDVNALLTALSAAAELGGTFKVTETDLSIGGIDMAAVEEFGGLESQLSAENGGIVLVLRAKAGHADAIAAQLATLRDSRMGNPDYAEFENARANTAEARIQVFGDYVVYAVCATGHQGGWPALDAAIGAAFA